MGAQGLRVQRAKYGNKKVIDDNIVFDSLAEHRRYRELKLMQAAGEINYLRVHFPYELKVNDILVCKYVADFSYHRPVGKEWTKHVLEDVKGVRAGAAWSMFRLKQKLFQAIHGYEIEVYPPIVKKPRKKRA